MKRQIFIRTLFAGLVAGASLMPLSSGAQVFSQAKPVRVIVPFAAAGANDLIARALQKPLGEALGTTVIVENRPGGSTKIATMGLIRAEPDGHTLLLLGQTGQMAWGMLEARADAPFKSWAELVSYAKKNPGKVSAGGPAVGGMMNLIVLDAAESAGIDVTYVPYAGGGPSGAALLGGHVNFRVAQPPEVYPNVKAGMTRGLAVAFPTRLPEMPDVPTLEELGIKAEVPVFGFDFWGPPNMSPELAAKISKAIEVALKDPGYIEVARRLTYQPNFVGPDELRTSIRNFEVNVGPRLEKAFPRKAE